MATEADGRQMAGGLGLPYDIICHFHRDFLRLPNLNELESYMNSKGWRDGNGNLTGDVPACTWTTQAVQPTQPARPAQPVATDPYQQCLRDSGWAMFGVTDAEILRQCEKFRPVVTPAPAPTTQPVVGSPTTPAPKIQSTLLDAKYIYWVLGALAAWTFVLKR